jgi:hypothetical protein
MSSVQHKEKFGQVAGVPLLGPSAGSAEAATNPMSPQNLAAVAVRQQVQATADTKYDPNVPAPVALEQEATVEKFAASADQSTKVTMGTALLIVSFVLLHSCLQKSFS